MTSTNGIGGSRRASSSRIQVWHAAGAFKKFGYSVLEKSFGADPDLVAKVRIHSNYDLALVSSMSVAPHYAEAFAASPEIFTASLGIPRTFATRSGSAPNDFSRTL